MSRLGQLLMLACAAVVAATTTGNASLGPAPSLDELVAQAESVFFGEVVDVRSFWETHDQGRSIVSRATFRVIETYKGPSPSYIELDFLGGTIGDITLSVSDIPQFRRGDRDVLFVNNAAHAISPVVGVAYGRFRVVRDPASGLDVVRTYANAPIRGLAALSPPLALAPRIAPELSLEQFTDDIARRVASAGRPQ